MSDITLDGAATGAATDGRARVFILGIIAATILPSALCVLSRTTWREDAALAGLGTVIILFAGSHVALSGFFWLDRRYRTHLNARPARTYVLPSSIVAACLAVVLIGGPDGQAALGIVLAIWTCHHFGRQNWGILCLAATGTRSAPPGPMERGISWWAPATGIAGILALLPPIAETQWAPVLHDFGYAAALGVGAVSLAAAARQLASGVPLLRAAMTAMAGLFFLPVFLVDDYAGPIAVGVAHSFQYALIMGYLAASRRGSSIELWTTPLLFMSVIHILAFAVMISKLDGAAAQVVAGVQTLFTGITIWHFLIDADVWRLREPFQRRALRESLPFLFR